DGGVPRHDDDLEGRILALHEPEQVQPIAVREDQVDQRQRELALLEPEHRADGAGGRFDFVALALEDQPQAVGYERLIVDDEDAGLHSVSPRSMIRTTLAQGAVGASLS